MRRLVFDSSTSWVVVGIWENNQWLATIEKAEAQSQSKQLFEVLQEVLEYHQIRRDEIKEIAVGVGPGSYTGLRIGLTVAKIWAYSAKIPLFQFSSEKLMASSREQQSDAEAPDLKLLKPDDFVEIKDINAILPVYSNDHFS